MTWLIQEFKVKSFVETGAWAGETPRYFVKYLKWAYTCENYIPRYLETVALCKDMNITVSSTPSPAFFDEIDPEEPIMFYLDAHWEQYWPLADELKYIEKRWPASIIVIDDAFVPDKPNFGGSFGGGFNTTIPIAGKALTDAKQSLDINFVKKHYDNTAQFLAPNYDDKAIGYLIINGTSKKSVHHPLLTQI